MIQKFWYILNKLNATIYHATHRNHNAMNPQLDFLSSIKDPPLRCLKYDLPIMHVQNQTHSNSKTIETSNASSQLLISFNLLFRRHGENSSTARNRHLQGSLAAAKGKKKGLRPPYK